MKKFMDLNHANFSLKFPFENKLAHFFSIWVKPAGPCMEFCLLPCMAQVGAKWPISRHDPFCEPLRYCRLYYKPSHPGLTVKLTDPGQKRGLLYYYCQGYKFQTIFVFHQKASRGQGDYFVPRNMQFSPRKCAIFSPFSGSRINFTCF